MRRSKSRLRVRYAETDQMGVVYYANYLVWMEVARVDHCRMLGFEYRSMHEDSGAFLAVTEAHCRYRASAKFNDEVDVEAWVSEVRSRSIRFSYEMRRSADEEMLATGETLHAVTNREGRMIRLPEQYREFFPLRAKGA
jgi:acyl-CoA thioester hydrolase